MQTTPQGIQTGAKKGGIMNNKKKSYLEKHGWKVGSATDFLNLSEEEAAFVEFKVALSNYLKERRHAKHLTQFELAKLLHSSQSRVAKMEKGDPSVSTDLLLKSLFSLGASRRELARKIAA